jgi:hypothetical protein
MSSEPKPRSMAAVTIEAVRPTCSSENKIWLFAGKPGVSPGTRPTVRAVTIRGVRAISRKDSSLIKCSM